MTSRDRAISPVRTVAETIGLAFLYLVIGQVSLLMAIPPGQAAPLWPAAGLALAAIVLLGNRVWLGVLLGAVALNAWNIPTTEVSGGLAGKMLTSLVIGLGATAQAVVGAAVVGAALRRVPQIERLRDLTRCQILGGPVVCVISPSVGVGALMLGGVMAGDAAFLNWLTWWIGDTIGVLLALPLLFIAPGGAFVQRAWRVGLPMGLCVAAVGLAFVHLRNAHRQQTNSEFDRRATLVVERCTREIRDHVSCVESIASFFTASDHVTAEEYLSFVKRDLESSSSLLAVGWAPLVTGTQRDSMVEAVRADGTDAFAITERGDDGALVRATPRDEHFPLRFVEPKAGNEGAIGFDLGSSGPRRDAIERARDAGVHAATRPLPLVGGGDGYGGVVLVAPVYRSVDVPETVEARREAFVGVAAAAFRTDDLVAAAVAGDSADGVLLRLLDVTNGSDPLLLHGATGSNPAPDSESSPSHFLTTHHIPVGGRLWAIEVAADADLVRANLPWGPWGLVIGGMLICVLLGDTLVLVTGREMVVERSVTERTAQLSEANERLAQKNEEMERFTYTVTHDLRSPLMAIQGFAGVLSQELRAGRRENETEYLGRILESSTHMERTIEDLLRLSRLGRAAADPEMIDSAMTARLVLDALGPRVSAAGAEVRVDPGMPRIWADEARVQQVFQNLIENALKYAGVDGRSLEIEIGGELRGDRHLLWVKDNGPGIDPAHHEMVFGLFNRVATGVSGTGLGLSIVRRIAEAHGGAAWVESTEGGGSAFYVSFAAVDEAGQKAAA